MSSQINQLNTDITFFGHDLVRPECVLTNAKGDVFVSDFCGGVTHINTNNEQCFYGGELNGIGKLKTNGFALLPDGSFLIAHLGNESGGVFRLTRNNQISPYLLEADGVVLPPTNFVHLDHQGRIWITVSTRTTPRANAYRNTCDDGFIVLVENGNARIVADGIGYTNECWVDPLGEVLYANATFSRELLRWDISASGELRNRTLHTAFDIGTFPDGLNADEAGNLWVTSIVSNRLIKVMPNGEQITKLQCLDEQHVDTVEQAFLAHQMGRKHLDNNPSQLKNISSLAFGGTSRTDMYLGCLLDSQIIKLPNTGVVGVKPAHWYF